nr:unnamed protein product [Callosobruchus chinensis]
MYNREVIHPINLMRKKHGQFYTLYNLLLKDDTKFFAYFRMYSKTFVELCGYVQHKIKKKNTKFKQSISVKEPVAVAIRFLATGHTFRALSFEFRIGRATISEIVKETCEAIWDTRDVFADYFISPSGSVPWQYNKI